MIVFAKNEHINQITKLWNEAFGDAESEISKYLEMLLKYLVIYEDNGQVLGMLTIIPISCGDKKGRYVYAVATLKSSQNRGISTSLLEFAKQYIKDNGEDFLILVPQSKGLFEFYKKRGFSTFSCVRKDKYINSSGEKLCSYKMDEITPREYMRKRKKFFEGEFFFEWDEDILNFAKEMYGGRFVLIREKNTEIGIAFCYEAVNELLVKELLTDKKEKVLNLLSQKYGKEIISYSYPDNTDIPFAMVYPEDIKGAYFNIALD